MPSPAVTRATDALAAGRLDDAARALRGHLQTHPGDADGVHLLGTVAERARAIREAEHLFRRALALDPAHDGAQLSLAALMDRIGRAEEARSMIAALLARSPTNHAAQTLRARMLVQHRRLDEADAAFRTLTRDHPGDWGAWMNHGHLLKALGRIDDAATAYRRSLTVAPASGIVWWALANLTSRQFDTADIAAMHAALAASTDDADRTHLHFALGRALDDPEAAFAHLQAGNALRQKHAPHDAAQFSATFRKAEVLFTAPFIASRTAAGALAPDPIFIVGLPRSGSTLVEQILASHPMIEATEELHDLNRIARAIATEARAGGYLDALPALSSERLRAFGDRYLTATRRVRNTDRPFFTDKMPSNWIYTGLIRLILPNARIVDVRRHPMACGFANYAQHFSWGNNFAYDLGDIGHFYADYVRHMAHIDAVAPGHVHRVIYEDLVADLDGEVRRLLDYLALPYDPACLRFHETDRAIHTPSTGQVRRPINRDGLDRWRTYAPWLGDLEAALGPILTSYPAVPPGW